MTQPRYTEYPPMGTYGRRLVSMTVPAFNALPDEIVLPSPHFVCLLCADARGVSGETIIDAATALLDQGLVYLCAWGPDSERVRHLFESAALVWNSHVAVLTVHLYETLDDALDYVLDIAYPATEYAPTCQTGVILNVGNASWADLIQKRLNAGSSVAQA